MQVSHQGRHIDGGFCSGAATDSPSAFMHQFSHTGVYYYISQAIPKQFGAIVVNSSPRVCLLLCTHRCLDVLAFMEFTYCKTPTGFKLKLHIAID